MIFGFIISDPPIYNVGFLSKMNGSTLPNLLKNHTMNLPFGDKSEGIIIKHDLSVAFKIFMYKQM